MEIVHFFSKLFFFYSVALSRSVVHKEYDGKKAGNRIMKKIENTE